MFTGLIESVGKILRNEVTPDGANRRMTIQFDQSPDLQLGESISVNGVCLTVVETNAESFTIDVSPTTLQLTTLNQLHPNHLVNLERSVSPSTRLGGHWVQGHVDTIGEISNITPQGTSTHIRFTYPQEFYRFIVPQGSITIDGISLTIVSVDPTHFSLTIIPHTLAHTTLSRAQLKQSVNIEFDVLGKYVDHLLQPYIGKDLQP